MIQHVCRVTPERWASFFDILTEAETRANQESINAGIFSADEFDFTQFKGAEPYTLNFERLLEVYWSAGTKLGICVGNVPEKVLSIISNGKYLIGEFGQSYWLDKRRGFTPNVTASHTFTLSSFSLQAYLPSLYITSAYAKPMIPKLELISFLPSLKRSIH